MKEPSSIYKVSSYVSSELISLNTQGPRFFPRSASLQQPEVDTYFSWPSRESCLISHLLLMSVCNLKEKRERPLSTLVYTKWNWRTVGVATIQWAGAAGDLGNTLLGIRGSHQPLAWGVPQCSPPWDSKTKAKTGKGPVQPPRCSPLASLGKEIELLCLLIPFVEVGGQFRPFLQLLRSFSFHLVKAFEERASLLTIL